MHLLSFGSLISPFGIGEIAFTFKVVRQSNDTIFVDELGNRAC